MTDDSRKGSVGAPPVVLLELDAGVEVVVEPQSGVRVEEQERRAHELGVTRDPGRNDDRESLRTVSCLSLERADVTLIITR